MKQWFAIIMLVTLCLLAILVHADTTATHIPRLCMSASPAGPHYLSVYNADSARMTVIEERALDGHDLMVVTCDRGSQNVRELYATSCTAALYLLANAPTFCNGR